MNCKLPSFALLLAALIGGAGNAQPPVANTATPNAVTDLAAAAYGMGTEQRIERGNAIMQAALESVRGQDSISARLRQQVNLLGHQLAGPGLYLQQGRGAARKFRLEMSIQRAQASSTISHVADGRFLWIYENLNGQPQLKIVDLRRVRDELNTHNPQSAPAVSESLAMGGLPRMLADLQAGFQFLPISETYLGDVPVHELRGVWRPEPLAKLLPDQVDAIRAGNAVRLDGLPMQVPHEVVIYIGKQGGFPHRVEYHRLNKEAEGPRTTAVVILELFEVRLNGPIDDQQFGKPANLPEADYTRVFLEKLGVKATE